MSNYVVSDTSLTSVADAIRIKGGTSAGLTFPSGFVSAIENIPTGSGFNMIEYIETVSGYMFRHLTLPKDYELRLRELTAITTYWLYDTTVTDSLTVIFDKQLTRLDNCFYGINMSNQNACDLYFDCDTSQCTNFMAMFRDAKMKRVLGSPIDFSSATNVNTMFYGGETAIEEIRFVPNTLKISPSHWSNVTQHFSSNTQISLANALNEGVTGNTITGYALNNRASIIGISELDESQTYHIFVEDQSGTLTLADFVTNVKGWTIT